MIVLVIGAIVFFGATKLPEIARNIGRAQGEFKKLGNPREGVQDDPSSDQPSEG